MPKIEWLKNMHKIKSGAGDVSLSEKRSIVNKGNKVVGRVYAALKMKVSNSVYTVGCKVQNPSGKSIAQVKLHHHIPPKSPCEFSSICIIEYYGRPSSFTCFRNIKCKL